MFLNWNDLTEEEKIQAEISYLSILDDIASDGDIYDKVYYEMARDDRAFRISGLIRRSFIRDNDGYIFVNI